MLFYDLHTHNIAFPSKDYDVQCILNTSPDEFISKVNDAPTAWYSCGIHPWYSENADQQINLLEDIVKEKQVVAIGEVGLDKIKGPDMNTQIEVFRHQIEIAIQADKPLIIHCVKAWEELIALYKEYKTAFPWILHGYRGNVEQTNQLSRLGFKFSIGERFNEDSVKLISLDSIFCETDMSDVSICQVYERISVCFGIDFCRFVGIVDENIKKIFK